MGRKGTKPKPKLRSDGEGSVYFDAAKGTWVGAVVVGRLPSGRPKRQKVSAATKKAASNAARDLIRARDKGLLDAAEPWTVAQWFKYWVPNISDARVRSSTRRGYETKIETWILPHLGHHLLSDLTAEHVIAMKTAMLKAPAVREGAPAGRASATIRQTLAILSAALQDAVKHDRVTRNVATLVDKPALSTSAKGKHLNAVHARAVVAELVDDRLFARWATALALGTRQGETLGVAQRITFLDTGEEWTAYDAEKSILRIDWELQRDHNRHGCGPSDPDTGVWPCGRKRPGNCPEMVGAGMMLTEPKSGKSSRVIGLDSQNAYLKNILDERVKLLRRERIQSGEGARWKPWETIARYRDGRERPVLVELLFGRENGRPVDPSRDTKAWTATLIAAGVPLVKQHGARHTAASLMIAAGATLRQVMETLGHSQFGITANLYTHLEEEHTRQTVAGAESALFGPAPTVKRRQA